MVFGDYIVFVDESGDHSLEKINPQFPIFVLAFCVFKKRDYSTIVCPRIQEFKFKWFGHDGVVLHEREILRDLPPFQFLKTAALKEQFLNELTDIIRDAPMTIIPSVIKKQDLTERYVSPHNPYHLSLLFCMERLAVFLRENGQEEKVTHLVFEQRGGKPGGGEEDRILELEFRRIVAGQNRLQARPLGGMEIQIIPKSTNSVGLQLADLVARPIGLRRLRPEQPNRAYEIIATKFCDAGVKVFP